MMGENEYKVKITEKVLKWIKNNFYKFMSILIVICGTIIILAVFGGFEFLMKAMGR